MNELRRELRLLVADRREGKTTQAMAWLSNGERTNKYPGWSRVLIAPTLQMVEHIRKEWWGKLEDFDHRVYSAEEWERIYHGHNLDDVEVCLDDLEWFLRRGIGRLSGRIMCATITAWPWERVEFEERRSVRL